VAAAIKRLERELDVRLFARTTRSLRLTAEGELYLPTAQRVLDTLRQGHEDLHGNHSSCAACCRWPRLRTWAATCCPG
jgi:DNA-binding transcriptional LysR family regulator